MEKNIGKVKIVGLVLILVGCLFSCKEKEKTAVPSTPDTTTVKATPFDINKINDTYADIAAYQFRYGWGPYNVHDPSIIKEGDYFYCYSTDVGFGIDVPAGLQIRKSKDLVNWQYSGTVFSGLPKQGADFITQNGGMPFNSLWAPYVLKVGNEFRLYYSLSSAKPRLSVIGLATSSSPAGPWTEKGLVVTSLDNATVQTNAIDPTVVVDQQGDHWFYYGSAWDGIYIIKLNSATGFAATTGDKGIRVAHRGSTGNTINGNEEGPEIMYNASLKKYFLFVAYDWLETKYNVRVGRSDSPEGPFLDYNGESINQGKDYGPMIVAPYQFMGHSGWQGTAHCSVFNDGNGYYYMAHQGRPGNSKYSMVLHVRKMFWTSDGWPVVSPERYAATEQTAVTQTEVAGKWEKIVLNYRVVPGYADTQTVPDFQVASYLELDASGTINGNAANTWTYIAPLLELKYGDGTTEKVFVERGRDWENKKACLIFTGLNNAGTAIWGKK